MAVKPVPFPFSLATSPAGVIIPKAAMITSPATRWQDDPKFTYVSAEPPDGWFQPASCTAPACIAWYDGFTFGGSDPVQRIEWQMTPADFPGLAPNKLVRVQGIIDWYRYSYAVDPVFVVLLKCNGAESFNPPEGWLGWGGGGPTPFNIVVPCDGSGNLNFEFGVYYLGGVSGSVSIGARLVEAEVIEIEDDPWDIIPDSAVLYVNGTEPISITRDSFSFDERAVFENYDYEGKIAPTEDLDELVSLAPILTGKFMAVGERQISMYQPGGSWSSTAFDRTYTHQAGRTTLTAKLTDVRCVWKRWSGGYIQVRFPKAIITAYKIGSQDKNEGEIPVTIEARQARGGNLKTTPLYYLDRLPSTWLIP